MCNLFRTLYMQNATVMAAIPNTFNHQPSSSNPQERPEYSNATLNNVSEPQGNEYAVMSISGNMAGAQQVHRIYPNHPSNNKNEVRRHSKCMQKTILSLLIVLIVISITSIIIAGATLNRVQMQNEILLLEMRNGRQQVYVQGNNPAPVVRLVGGGASYGRVELLHEGQWGTVCDDSWNLDDARVVCRMLGFNYATSAPGSARYGQGTGMILLDDVLCAGTEDTIWECPANAVGVNNCGHSEDASVICSH